MTETPIESVEQWRKEVKECVTNYAVSFHALCKEMKVRDQIVKAFIENTEAIPRIPTLEKMINFVRKNK